MPFDLHDQKVVGIWLDDSQAAGGVHLLLGHVHTGICSGNDDCAGEEQENDCHGVCGGRKENKMLKLGQSRRKQR